MMRLPAPRDESELMILASLLESDGIAYCIQNEHFGGLYPGLNIFPFNERVILVDEADYDRASLVARDFFATLERSWSQQSSVSTIHPPDCLPRNTDSDA